MERSSPGGRRWPGTTEPLQAAGSCDLAPPGINSPFARHCRLSQASSSPGRQSALRQSNSHRPTSSGTSWITCPSTHSPTLRITIGKSTCPVDECILPFPSSPECEPHHLIPLPEPARHYSHRHYSQEQQHEWRLVTRRISKGAAASRPLNRIPQHPKRLQPRSSLLMPTSEKLRPELGRSSS